MPEVKPPPVIYVWSDRGPKQPHWSSGWWWIEQDLPEEEQGAVYIHVPGPLMMREEAWERIQDLIESDEDFNALSDFIELAVGSEPVAVASLLAEADGEGNRQGGGAMSFYDWRFDYSLIPAHTLGGLKRYEEQGCPPGDFLRYVLENDLRGAVGHADLENMKAIVQITLYVCNEISAPTFYKGCVKEHCDQKRKEREVAGG